MTASTPASQRVTDLAARLEREAPTTECLRLAFGGERIDVRSNSHALLDHLRTYFAAFDGGDHARPADLVVRAHQMTPPELDLPYREWPREPGKRLGKEAFFDLDDGRAVLKIRTGMQFLVGPDLRVACGDCLANPNQVVNFIDFQYMAWLMNQGLALCHAAGVTRGGRGLGLAGLAGGGKSTLALHLISAGFCFTSNDRLLVGPRPTGQGHVMKGIPKHPRINPGTALANPDLVAILEPERRRALEPMPREALWSLEEKSDAEIDRLFGPGRVVLDAPLDAFLILAWSHRDPSPARFTRVDLATRPDLLDAVMKAPGPFYLPDSGPWPQGHAPPDAAFYLERMRGLPVWVAEGGVDFARGVDVAHEILDLSPPERAALQPPGS
ncbi:MAG: HprK-related kinase B [Myxococcota bacterium]